MRRKPSPVGVGAGDGGFDQRRIGDGAGQARGGIVTGRASDFNGDELLGAFAIARDGLRQVLEDAGDFLFHAGKFLGFGTDAGSAVSKQHERVVGGGVAIYRQAVVTGFGGALEDGAQGGGGKLQNPVTDGA